MNQRLLSIDLIKIVAMCAVMCLHTQYAFSEESTLAHFLYVSAVVAIPLFFTTSGYLMLGRKDISYAYVFRKIYGILRFVTIITIGWYLIFGIRHGESFLWTTVGSLLQGGSMSVFWYLGAMIIIYALLPFLNRLYNVCYKRFIILTITLFVVASVIFILNFSNDIHLEQNTIQTFRLWNWLMYFCLGGIFKRWHVSVNWYIVVGLLGVNYVFQMQLFPYLGTRFCEYFYSSLPAILLSSSVFLFLKNNTSSWLRYVNWGVRFFSLVIPFIVF